MKNDLLKLPATRREFFQIAGKGIGMLAFAHYAPSFLTSSVRAQVPGAEKDRTILVLIQLAGGNDGLNTVIPFENDAYFRLRPTLGMRKNAVIPVTEQLGLHPSLAGLHQLYGDGKLAIVQNVGYPNPNRSHFRSMEIWETGTDADVNGRTGWLGRYFDNTCQGSPEEGPVAIHASQEVPQSFLAERPHSLFGISGQVRNRNDRASTRALLERLIENTDGAANDNASFLKHTLMDSLVTERRVQRLVGDYRQDATYPTTQLAQSLRGVASLISGNLPTRVYFVSHSGFDTHANQAAQHARLLRELSEAMVAFQQDLTVKGLADQVLTMTFSEFGRRPNENAGAGTDHGTSAPLFVMGSRIHGGMMGTAPSLDLPANGDISFSTDFRQVYSTVLDKWLGCAPEKVLGRSFDPIPFV
jgi:uncharacterized protein (DUF1501 family)